MPTDNTKTLQRRGSDRAHITAYKSGTVAGGAQILSPDIDCRGIQSLFIECQNSDAAARNLLIQYLDEDGVLFLTETVSVTGGGAVLLRSAGFGSVFGGSSVGVPLAPFMRFTLVAGGTSNAFLNIWADAFV